MNSTNFQHLLGTIEDDTKFVENIAAKENKSFIVMGDHLRGDGGQIVDLDEDHKCVNGMYRAAKPFHHDLPHAR